MEDLKDLFQLMDPPPLAGSQNIAPTQIAAVVRVREEVGKREWAASRWGLIPSWAEDKKIGNRLINARAETAAEKPSFRSAFRARRCLVAADGFYEWAKKVDGTKQPFRIGMIDQKPFAMAGLWETWHSPDDQFIDSFTILTTEANELVRPLHDRMPVIIDRADFDLWLDPRVRDPKAVQPLLRPYDAGKMRSDATKLL